MKKLLLSALVISAMFVSCGKDDAKVVDTPPTKPATDKEQVDGFAQIKEFHAFKAGDGKIQPIYDKLKDQLAVDPSRGSNGNKNQKAVQEDFEKWVKGWDEKATSSVVAKQGTAGVLDNRVLDEKGFEYFQLIKKGFIGAYQFSNALKEGVKAMAPNANNKEIFEKVTYYLIGGEEYLDKPKNEKGDYEESPGNEFVKYLNKVNKSAHFNKIGDEMFKALRAAKKEMNTAQFGDKILEAITIAKQIAAIRGVYYLLEGASKLEGATGDKAKASAFHATSEGLGFVYSLQFTYNYKTHKPYLSGEDVDKFFEKLDLWNPNAKTILQTEAKKIADLFGFKAEDAK